MSYACSIRINYKFKMYLVLYLYSIIESRSIPIIINL